MNLYKKNMLKHAMPMNPRRHHKYLYIDANGNYVYPEDVARKAGNKAKALNSQGQANAVNMRKERAERIKAGNNKIVDKLKGVYDQGQANNINARKARAESINAGNERVANSKAYKIGKTILGESKAGKAIKKIGKSGIVVGKELSKVTIPEGQRAKQKSKEEIAREDAELERRVSEGIEEFGRQQAEKYYKEQAKKKAEQLPEGWVRDQNGYVYDDIRAMAIDPNDPRLKKKKKRAKKNIAKVVKTSVAHSDTYRSNVMNSHQRMIYSSQLQHAERRNHKYLYKIGDRYVYPEDVKNNAKSKVQGFVADQKQKLKDKKYLWDENRRKYPNLEKANVTSPGGKRVNQITSAHQEGTKKTTALSYQSTHDPISNKVVKVKRDFDKDGNQIGVGYSTESSHIGKKKKYNEKAKEVGFQAEMERRQATINARNAKDRKSSDFANLTKAERDTAERKKSREASTKNTEQQRKSAHAGYEADKKAFPEGGSTEELERQKKKTKARKSASKRFNELDQKNKRSSNSMEPDIHKQHSQINSAHQMATERRLAGNKHSDREWNRQNLYSVNYYDQSGSIERQKRKTALRKRHKK